MHTLAPGIAIVLIGFAVPPLRATLVAFGLVLLTHSIRDAATSSTPVLWPLIDNPYHLRYSSFLATLALCATVTAGMVALPPGALRE